MNFNDLLGAVQGNDDDKNGLSSLMDIAKDFDMQDLERYKSMSKMEILEELKNSEHSETVLNFLKGLLNQKSDD